jgi:predicted ATPase
VAEEWVHETRPVRRVECDPDAPVPEDGWPVSVPAVAQLLAVGLELAPGVTFLVGENGSGKSTLVEAVAEAFGLDVEGGTPYGQHRTRRSESPLGSWLRLVRGPGAPRWGFFLRAESMHGYYTYLESERLAPVAYHEMSHGESFLELMASHLDNPGLYCLDEPEAALSFTSVLALVGRLDALARGGAQVLCATHSPVLCALPGARILEVGDWGLRESRWEDLLLVEHYRSFLSAPQRYLRHVVDAD